MPALVLDQIDLSVALLRIVWPLADGRASPARLACFRYFAAGRAGVSFVSFQLLLQ